MAAIQFGHRRQSDGVLSPDARVHGTDQQIPHVLSATKTGERRHVGRHKGEPPAGLREHKGVQSDDPSRGT